ncbi:MAG: DUF2232 domain-containing protein [Candidatus Firestonebacteria bacterium]|nr:DUF2232 domain-containing protein [Candidatus Firestonebacteria bacterium]
MNTVLAVVMLVCLLALYLGSIGGVVRLGLKLGWTPVACWAAAVGAALLLAGGLLAWAGHGVSVADLWQTWQKEFSANLNASLAVYRQLGMAEADLQTSARWIRLLFVDAAPGWGLCFIFFAAWLVVLWQRRVSPHLPGSKIAIKPFMLWSVPDLLIWPLLATLVLLRWGGSWNSGYFLVALNAAVVLGNFYLLSGLAIFLFFLMRWKVPQFLQLLAIMLIGLFPMAIGVLVALGVVNTWWDWRRITPNQTAG